jgi:hypothetical protein
MEVIIGKSAAAGEAALFAAGAAGAGRKLKMFFMKKKTLMGMSRTCG